MNESEESVDLDRSDVEGGFQSQFRELYKKRNVLNQEERRRRTLESQKRKRNQLFNLNRDLSKDVESSVEDMVVCKSEAEFRSYWLRTKFEETPALECATSKNHCRLELLPSTLYSPSDLANTFGIGSVWACGNPPLDGILFYHRNGHYQSGENTPLVGWLKPFMVPEVLGVEVPDSLMNERPDNYISMEQFIEEYTAERKRSKSKKFDMQVDEYHEESIDSESVNVEFEESDSTCLA
ncbi:hypothetical protein J437_LFUL015342 [Ladona fulva]|uniref:Snurportin-1 n=1 Tax=Ladona fulva TaxID=123851 RepID=A0A8K0KLZ9_LADFU|nr:hypothetical protein J437_LFUL015342 [Ladona fulva]